MTYKVLDVFKDLPQTNCKDCGFSGCFAFATAVFLEGEPLIGCPHIDPLKLSEMEVKLSAGRSAGEGKKDDLHVQALAHLRKTMESRDFATMAKNSKCRYEAGPPKTLRVDFLGQELLVTLDGVDAKAGEEPSVWVKVFLYIYLTRATGSPKKGNWITFRELPHSVSKSKNFEEAASVIADHFENDVPSLEKSVEALGGKPTVFGSTDKCYIFQALPRVELMLLYWEGTSEFTARSSVLMDGAILDYLDHEAIVFLVEAFAKRITGSKVAEVIP
jgi:hypothetical protein